MKQTEFGKSIMKQRYIYPGENTWADIAKRVSSHIASVEKNGDIPIYQTLFYDMIEGGDFIPGGRILYGSARPGTGLMNCFALEFQDNRHSIAEVMSDTYLISTSGGGVGINVSNIRPKGDPIRGIEASAPGVISEMKKVDAIGEQVRSGGGRRAALLSLLNISHPDALEFIDVKLDTTQLTNHNISIGITKKFIDAVKKNKPWTFKFGNKEYRLWKFYRKNPDGRHKTEEVVIPATDKDVAVKIANAFYKIRYDDFFDFIEEYTLMAKDLWNKIVDRNMKSGEPGFLFIDNIETYFNNQYFQKFSAPNPCAELPLPHGGSCCLGSINLSSMYDEKKNDVDWSKLGKTIKTGVRFLDNVLTVNRYPIPASEGVAKAGRQIGLGTLGLHYLLIKLGFKYGSKKSLEFLERLYATIRNEAYEASIELAKEKGAFPEFDLDEYINNNFVKKLPPRLLRKIKKYGIRNVSCSTVAPTGTVSMIAGVSSGIEPIFAPVYERNYRVGNSIHKETVMDSLFAEFVNEGKNLKAFRGAYDITPEEHLAVQSTIQEFVDASLSKTINLPPNYDSKNLADTLLDFTDHLKGVTIYQAGSRGDEPLKVIDWSELDREELLKTASKYTVNIECENGSCEI